MKWIINVALVIAATGTMVAGTGFLGAKGGESTFTLNDKIQTNKIDFLSEAPAETINGVATGLKGSFTLNPTNLEATKGTIMVEVQSMKTAISKRDDHMYSSQWLDAEKFPMVSFTVESLKNVRAQMVDGRNVASADAVGTFTIHGVTKPIIAKLNITYLPENADTKKRAEGDLAMVNATFEVALSDFDIKGSQGVVGKSVGKTIEVSASLFANSK